MIFEVPTNDASNLHSIVAKDASLLRSRSFLPLLSSLSISSLGNEMQSIAFLWWTLNFTNSAAQTAGVAFFITLPRLLFSPLAGTIADRYDRRRLIFFTEGISALIIAVAAILIHFNYLRTPLLYLINFALNTLSVLAVPTQQALVPNLVGIQHAARANALLQLVRSMAGVIGPAVGGALIALVGIESVTWMNCVSFIISCIAINRLPSVDSVTSKLAGGLRKGLFEGIFYLWTERGLLKFFLIMMIANTLLTPYAATLPVMAKDVLRLGPEGFGLLGTAFFAGVMLSNLILSKMGRPSLIRLLGWGLALVGTALFSFGLSDNVLQGVFSLLALGALVTLVTVTTVTFLQGYVPDYLRGRIFAVRYMTSSGVQAFGIVLSGLFAEQIGARLVFIIAGLTMIFLGFLVHLTMKEVFISFSRSLDE